jgi:hypothetical protein
MARRETKDRIRKQKREAKKRERRTRHHRLPRSLGGGNNLDNISLVHRAPHQAYHLLFGAGESDTVAEALNHTWLPIQAVLVTIPTERLLTALDLLRTLGIHHTVESLGLTTAHRKLLS